MPERTTYKGCIVSAATGDLLPCLRNERRLVLAPLVLAVAMLFMFTGTVFAVDQALSTDLNIAQLETKFFQHDYPKDTTEARLERLEKMVFGEAKSGSNYERLASLLSAVPNPKIDESESAEGLETPSLSQHTASGQGAPEVSRKTQAEDTAYMPPDSSKYPAVTAIETRLLGRDYATEPVNKRLDRLEIKLFGKTSGIEDLSERVDRIKQRTGVDIAKQAPPGSDWADEDEAGGEINGTPPMSSAGEDGKSFSGRNLRQDMQSAYGIPSSSDDNFSNQFNGSGTYGMGNTVARGRGSAQGGGSGYRSSPPTAPPRSTPNQPTVAPPLGLNQQVGALEGEIFGKSFPKDSLPTRLSRLESTVFPQERPAADKPLPDRVSRLLSVIPLSGSRQIAQNARARSNEAEGDDLTDMDMSMNQPAQPQTRSGGGLSKIINSIGNFLSGGFAGGYPMSGGGLITDPQTGLLYDSMSGNLIDPRTGVVVGQRMGSGTMGGFGSFSNGFSPFGSMPYGMGSGMGMRFGMGGMGMGRSGFGMWP